MGNFKNSRLFVKYCYFTVDKLKYKNIFVIILSMYTLKYDERTGIVFKR